MAFGEAGLRGFCNHFNCQQLHLYTRESHPVPPQWQKASHHPDSALVSDAQGFMPYQMSLPLFLVHFVPCQIRRNKTFVYATKTV